MAYRFGNGNSEKHGRNTRNNNRRRGPSRTAKIWITVGAALFCLTAVAGAYWVTSVKPPEGGPGHDAGVADAPDAEPEDTPVDPEDMRRVIEEQAQEPDLSEFRQKDGFFTILVAGLDADEYLTDTIIVAVFNVNDKSVAILNVPRDTLSKSKNGSIQKINSAYARGGVDRFKTEIKNVLGFGVNRYVIVNFSAFERIVDAIGGIDVDIPRDMYKNTGDMVIDLKAGAQTLDGKHALMYMRYRGYPNADLARIEAQQGVYREVISKLAKPATILKLPSLTSTVAQNVRTDLTVGEMIWIGVNYVGMNSGDVVTNTMPCYPIYIGDISYVAPDGAKILKLVNEYYNPYEADIAVLNLIPTPASATDRPVGKVDKDDGEPLVDDTGFEDDRKNVKDDGPEKVPDWLG